MHSLRTPLFISIGTQIAPKWILVEVEEDEKFRYFCLANYKVQRSCRCSTCESQQISFNTCWGCTKHCTLLRATTIWLVAEYRRTEYLHNLYLKYHRSWFIGHNCWTFHYRRRLTHIIGRHLRPLYRHHHHRHAVQLFCIHVAIHQS